MLVTVMLSLMPGHAGTQTADAADDERDANARLARFVERADDVAVDELVALEDDAPVAVRLVAFHFLADVLENRGARRVGRNDELTVLRLGRITRHHVEEVGDVGANVVVRREQPVVRVDLRGRGVVVPRRNVHVALHAVRFATNDETKLGVDLEADEAVDDVDPRLFHLFGPVDVALFVKARLQFDDGRTCLPRRRASMRAATMGLLLPQR